MNTLRTLLFLFFAVPFAVFAQEDTAEQETLLSGDIVHGGYGGPALKVSSIKNSAQVLTGGYGGWLINHTFMIGLGGYGLVNNIDAGAAAPLVDGQPPKINLGYGGLVLEYIINPQRLIHFSVQSLIGAGGAGYFSSSTQPNITTGTAFFVAELGANVQLNVASFCRFSVGASYRFANGVDLAGLTNKDISGPSGNVAIVFGKF